MDKIVVLFVDDEDDFRVLSILHIRRLLRDSELEFVDARRPQEALELIAGGLKPDLMVLDYAMPAMTGVELIKRIDEEHPDLKNVPCILISGYNLEENLTGELGKRCAFFEKRIDVKTFYRQMCEDIAVRFGLSRPGDPSRPT